MASGLGVLGSLRKYLPDLKGQVATAAQGKGPADYPLAFSVKYPELEHTVNDTLGYARFLASRTFLKPVQCQQEVVDYVTAFADRSKVLKEIDSQDYPIMCGRMTKTHPNIIIELARAIPLDHDGGTRARLKFLSEKLSYSHTLMHHFAEYGYEQHSSALTEQPSAVWAIRRAFRSLNEEGQCKLIFALGNAIPKHGILMMANMYQDFAPFPIIDAEKRAPSAHDRKAQPA